MLCRSVFVLLSFFLLNIALSVDFRSMVNSVVTSNICSYEYLLQCFLIYFAIFFILLKTNTNVILKTFELDIYDDIQLYFTYFAPEVLNSSAHSSGL
jgi:hypothetical protein